MSKSIRKLCPAAFFLIIFLFLFVWFSRVHALVPYDSDDWTYLAYVRSATPIWGEWNPSKVFPEVLFPFFSTIAAFVLAPLTHDYITAQTLMHAFVVSASITGYLWCFSCLLRRCFSLPRLTAYLTTALFLVFHFLAMRSQVSGNQYLLYCVDLNCYYNYLLPDLLNASLVMCLVANPRLRSFLTSGAPVKKGCFYIVVYFAIFSNLPSSGILAAYAGSVLLLDLIRRIREKRWTRFFPENAFPIGVLSLWLVSAVFELSGGRAGVVSPRKSIAHRILVACSTLVHAIADCNRVFLAFVFVVLLAACIGLLICRRKEGINKPLILTAGTLLIAAAAYVLYMILLCAVVNPRCLTRSEYLFGIFFYGTLLVMLALAFLLHRYPGIQLALPLLVLVMASLVNTRGSTFLESTSSNTPPSVCADISRELIRQLQEADSQGLTEVTLRVPKHVKKPNKKDNWPHSYFLMKRFPGTLYFHGLISRQMEVTVQADPALNEQFNLPIPKK